MPEINLPSATQIDTMNNHLSKIATPLAVNVGYDKTLSGMTATNVQDAITELKTLNNNLDANKANKTQPNWIIATLQNGWTGNLFYRKNQLGQLEIQFASLKAGTVADFTTITTFPVNFRPGANAPITVYCDSTGESVAGIVVLSAGELKIRTPASTKIATGQYISSACLAVI